MTRRTYLTAAEAAAALGVRLPTLYAYVSRGLLRSEPVAGGRGRRYPAADVEALRQRSALRREDAVDLARRGESLERVAALLWLGRLDAPLPAPAPWRLAVLPRLEPELAASRAWRPFQRMQVWLPLATAEDPGAS